MKYQFSQRRGKVTVDRRIVGIDPVQVEIIHILRPDGRQFRIVGSWGSWIVRGDSGNDELVLEHGIQLFEWLKSHSLPSLAWIEGKINQIEQSYAEDPMGHPSQYI